VKLETIVVGRIAPLAGDSGFGWTEAIGIAGGRVVASGPRTDLEGLAGSRTHRIELAPDEVALPALTDAHIHLVEAVRAASQVDLTGAATLDDGLALVAEADRSLELGAWLEGTGWDAFRWGAWPTAADLDRAAPGRPAYLWSRELHQVWVSTPALTAAGIDA
jgi:predicted amidohydrolase YtcJ